jgi:putative transposase
VRDLLCEPRFADLAPAEIYAALLDDSVYHCSIRTMYQILDATNEVRERRSQMRHPITPNRACWPKHPTSSGLGISPS